jgi:hypothetical protein
MTGAEWATAIEGSTAEGELAALGPTLGEEELWELLDGFVALAGENRSRGRRFGVRLLVVLRAAALDQAPSAVVEVELMLAALEMADGLTDPAEPRLTGLLAQLDEERDPGWVASAEAMLGTIARELHRPDEAILRWDRCVPLSHAAGDLVQAAGAATSAAVAAGEANRGDEELYRRWLAAAERCAAADQADDALQSGVNAGVYAIKLVRATVADGDAAAAYRTSAEAYRAVDRFGAHREAGELAVMTAAVATDLEQHHDEVPEWTAAARRAYRMPDIDPTLAAPWLAYIDFAEGNALLLRGRPAAAEPLIARALAGYEQVGDVDGARRCRMQLLAIAAYVEPDGERPGRLFEREEWSDPDTGATASYAAELAARRAGRDADAIAGHARTKRLLQEADEPVKAVAQDIEYATWRLARGDPEPVGPALAAAEACLAAPGPGTPQPALRMLATVVTLLRADLARRGGDLPAAVALLAGLERDLLSVGSGDQAARAAVSRMQLLTTLGRPAEALSAGLPAALALDALRFSFIDAERRRKWATVAAESLGAACRAAVLAGAHRVLAELLEVQRSGPIPRPQPGESTGLDALLAEASQELTAARSSSNRTSSTAVPGAAALLGAGRTALGLPARIRTPWGSVALSDALVAAERYRRPVRAAAVVEWRLPGTSPVG